MRGSAAAAPPKRATSSCWPTRPRQTACFSRTRGRGASRSVRFDGGAWCCARWWLLCTYFSLPCSLTNTSKPTHPRNPTQPHPSLHLRRAPLHRRPLPRRRAGAALDEGRRPPPRDGAAGARVWGQGGGAAADGARSRQAGHRGGERDPCVRHRAAAGVDPAVVMELWLVGCGCMMSGAAVDAIALVIGLC
jgi:hypothetical protein